MVQSICNKCGSFAIATNIFQKIPKLSDFPILNCKGTNWDLVWMQGKKIRTSYSSAVFFPFFLSVFHCGWMVFSCDCMFFKSKNKANLYQIKNFTLFKNVVFFIKILLKNCKKQVHKGYPLAGPCICNKKLELALAIRNNLPGSSRHFFPFFLSVFNCGWMVFNCDCMFFKSKNKANLYQIKNFTLFKKAVFFIKNPFKQLQKAGPQRVSPCRSLHLQQKTGISTCNKKQPSWL